MAHNYALPAWRQHRYLQNQLKKHYHKARNLKHLNTSDSLKQADRQHEIEMAHLAYIKFGLKILNKAETTLFLLTKQQADADCLENLEYFIAHGRHQISLIHRRVIQHEVIPHSEKVFSLFEPHTEWICKGKAGVPVELGLRVCVLQDQFGFTLHHLVMKEQTDDQVTVSIAEGAKQRFASLYQVSYDKGFWSKTNLVQLSEIIEHPVLPKKGKLSADDKKRESHPEFIRAKRKHSAVESDINGLESGGLDKCPDKGLEAFKRYTALAIVGRNLNRLGKILLERDRR